MRKLLAALLIAQILSLNSNAQAQNPKPEDPARRGDPEVATLALHQQPVDRWEPGKVRYTIRIETHKDNFWFCAGFVSPDAYVAERVSCQQLNGIYSPRYFYFEYTKLTEGHYKAFVQVFRVPNRLATQVEVPFRILPPLENRKL